MTKTDFSKRYVRKFVVDHLYFHGSLRLLLTNKQQWQAYCLADGLGKCSEAELKEINGGWDWSHIRDSSDEALREMAEFILKAANWQYNNIDDAADCVYLALRRSRVSHDVYFGA